MYTKAHNNISVSTSVLSSLLHPTGPAPSAAYLLEGGKSPWRVHAAVTSVHQNQPPVQAQTGLQPLAQTGMERPTQYSTQSMAQTGVAAVQQQQPQEVHTTVDVPISAVDAALAVSGGTANLAASAAADGTAIATADGAGDVPWWARVESSFALVRVCVCVCFS